MANAHTFTIRWPVDDSEIEIRIELAYWERLLKHLPTDFRNLETVCEVLRNPNRIFRDLNRPLSDSSNRVCVAGKPQLWYVGKRGSSVPFPRTLVYVVFLSERNSVFEFRSEKADRKDPLSPIGWETRFGRVIWKRNS